MKRMSILICGIFLWALSCQPVAHEKDIIVMNTSYGEIRIKLYEKTRKHRLNFIKLAKEGYFDNMSFHRIIKEFMIQTGDPHSKDDQAEWGGGGPNYEIDAEIFPEYFHKRGVLSAARLPDSDNTDPNNPKPVNPMRRSSGSQFFIVQGKKYHPEELDEIEKSIEREEYQHFAYLYMMRPETEWIRKMDYPKMKKDHPDSLQKLSKMVSLKIEEAYKQERKPFTFTQEQRKIYMETGGAPFLDRSYTAFGEVISGIEVVDKIAAVETLENDRPVKPIKITVRVLD